MANFFNVKDNPTLKTVTFARIADPATVSGGNVVYLDADPTGGAWMAPPAFIKAKTGLDLTSKLVYVVPYTAAP